MQKTFSLVLIIALFSIFTSTAFSESPQTGDSDTVPLSSAPSPLLSGTLMAVGDLSFTDGLGAKILVNPEYPWHDVKEVLDRATVLVGNLEAPFSKRGAVYTKKAYLFRVDPRSAQTLATGGFKVVTLANNHMMDYGPLSLQDTLYTLNRLHILHTGAGMNLETGRKAAFFTTADGIRFAFLAYSLTFPKEFWAGPDRPGTVYGDPAVFLTDIKKAKEVSDYVVVSFHWGEELKNYPLPYQKAYAHQCIDAGASVVLGHHPHVLQGLEVYHGGLVAYSLGNFNFGSYSQRNDSIILAVEYDRQGLTQAKLYPVNINNAEVAFRPRFRHGVDAERVIQDLRIYSAEFKTRIISEGEVGVIQIQP